VAAPVGLIVRSGSCHDREPGSKAGDWRSGFTMPASARSSRAMPRFRSQPCGRRSARLIRAATIPGPQGRMMPPASSRSTRVGTARGQAGVADQCDGRWECSGAVRPGAAGQAGEDELANGGRLPAAIGGDRGEVERPGDRLDAHRAPLGRHAIAPSATQPLGSVLVSFTPVRSCPPADVNRLPAQVRYTRGRWWMARRSPRKRVRGQPLRGFKSHLHRQLFLSGAAACPGELKLVSRTFAQVITWQCGDMAESG
jgi:hypothetical protein